ncbi:MAG: biotin/lipoyl-containing protein, partial [Gammaproteobacteria bacterium]
MSDFLMPSLGSDMESGRVVEWLVGPGDEVASGDIIAVIETEKGAIDIEIFEDGVIESLVAELDVELPVGAVLATLVDSGTAPPAEPATAEPATIATVAAASAAASASPEHAATPTPPPPGASAPPPVPGALRASPR